MSRTQPLAAPRRAAPQEQPNHQSHDGKDESPESQSDHETLTNLERLLAAPTAADLDALAAAEKAALRLVERIRDARDSLKGELAAQSQAIKVLKTFDVMSGPAGMFKATEGTIYRKKTHPLQFEAVKRKGRVGDTIEFLI